MDKKFETTAKDEKKEGINIDILELDDICCEIFSTLMAHKRLGFNELHRALKIFGYSISKPTLIEHLKHLKKKKAITRKREGGQRVSYGLTKEIQSMLHTPEGDIARWLEVLKKNPEKLGFARLNEKERLARLSDKQLEKMIDRDINKILVLKMYELKNLVAYNIKIVGKKSYVDFYKFVADPIYKSFEKRLAIKCRSSKRYRKKFFEKLNVLINNLDEKENKTQFDKRFFERYDSIS